jgi:hypothetical protein
VLLVRVVVVVIPMLGEKALAGLINLSRRDVEAILKETIFDYRY